MSEQTDKAYSEEAKRFVDKMYPCEPPCDSYGVCSNCCERNNFDCGWEFGMKALAESERKLALAREALVFYSAQGVFEPYSSFIKKIHDYGCKARQTLRELDQIGGA